ncbi:MAG TPA: CBS domain-containing protein [Candidatus Tumulicola sp.]|nr:CBS domain-containing protein [Candidatus Tumulicola sp.]HSC31803.1 CBS domain-containing protein [Gemmatimonadaceae bacterium]
MKLSDLVRVERVVTPLDATTLEAAALVLVERITGAGVVDDPAKLRSRVEEGRGEDIVMLGDRAFLTHYRTDAVLELVVAVGVAASPIPRDAQDVESQQARLIVLIVAPPRQAARYLQVLGAFSRLLSRPDVVEAWLAAQTPAEIAGLAALGEIEITPHLAVRDVMTIRPHTTRPEVVLRDAAREMVRAGVGGLPVVDADGMLVGMLSERELMRHMLVNAAFLGGGRGLHGEAVRHAGGADHTPRTVRDVMTRQVLCVSPDQPLAEVASVMSNKDVERVPVVRDGRLVGFLTRGDIVRKLIGS